MTNEEILTEINLLKSEVHDTIKSIQSLKTQLEQSRIPFNEFKQKKTLLEEHLRNLLKQIAQLKESVQFEVKIERTQESEAGKLTISKETEELMYYFQTEFEEFVNKAKVYLSGTVDDIFLEMSFIELFYPPVAQRSKPFNVACVAVQRGAQNIDINISISHLNDIDPSKHLSNEGVKVKLTAETPEVSIFQIQADQTHQYSFRGVLKQVEDKAIPDINDIFYDFEVKILPFFETGIEKDFFQTKTGRYLTYIYLACEKEQVEMIQELKEYLNEFGIDNFDPLMQIVPGAKAASPLLELGQKIQETIIFVIDHFKLIQVYQNFEKIDQIEQEILELTKGLFKFKSEGIIINSLEGIENCLKLSMTFRLFFKICKLGLRKLLILKTILGIGKDYGYDISKYFIYIKKTPIV